MLRISRVPTLGTFLFDLSYHILGASLVALHEPPQDAFHIQVVYIALQRTTIELLQNGSPPSSWLL